MEYVSTRGRAQAVGFERALLDGLAPDGGLYMPARWPQVSGEEIEAVAAQPFSETAAWIVGAYAGEAIDRDTLGTIAREAYASFDHPDTAPLRPLGGEDWLLELHHGPTLAFKDVAMQLLGRLFDHFLARRDARVTIIGATSGDTGAAAIEAFRGQDRADVFILHPQGRVSEVQRRIMTSVADANIFNIAIAGTFDDCQRIVKSLFNDRAFAGRLRLGGVNSINWVRLAVHIVYYFTAAAAVGAPTRRVSFTVPTGNFGDVFAGYAAKKMGLSIDRLCVAVNRNDILHRALTSGLYQPQDVCRTASPSMDIQVASNFERLVFETSGRDPRVVRDFMADVEGPDGARLPDPAREEILKDFTSEAVSEAETAEAIAAFARAHAGRGDDLVDPHTAVGIAATEKARARGALEGPVVTLATAHAAKFPEAVAAASGRIPVLPERFRDLHLREERCLEAGASVEAVKALMLERARAA